MKYIVIQLTTGAADNRFSLELPIIFPNTFVHSEVYEANVAMLRKAHEGGECKAVSAGEINFIGTEFTCCGQSDTLKLSNRGVTDAHLIKCHDYTSGYV